MFDLEALESVRDNLKFRGAQGMSNDFRTATPTGPLWHFTDIMQERLELRPRFWRCECVHKCNLMWLT